MSETAKSAFRLRTIEWRPDHAGALVPGCARFVDQRRLPGETVWVETRDWAVLVEAIRSLRVRGAPAIGIAAAMGVALAAQGAGDNPAAVRAAVQQAADTLRRARPTAVNLGWALDRMARALAALPADAAAGEIKERLALEASVIRDEDAQACRAIGEHGVGLLRDGMRVLTHCNAGALATAEYGTALAPIYVAKERGWTLRVFADETRPHWQGARLTAWELQANGIPVTLLCDNAAAVLMREKKVDAVLVGADRIAANGDVANKIGTYGLARLARAHDIPFYVFEPVSTFDVKTARGADIPIEFRGADELTVVNGQRIAPENVEVFAPIFDVTPAEWIAAIVCERGILRPPFDEAIRRLFS